MPNQEGSLWQGYRHVRRMREIVRAQPTSPNVQNQVESTLTLAQVRILRPRLAIVVLPRRQVRVRIRLRILADVICSWEVVRVASNVDRVARLVHPDVVYVKVHRKRHVRQVDGAEVARHAKVHDQVLQDALSEERRGQT